MRVVILGCGYVGLELGRRLLEAGHEPIGVRRSSEGIESIANAGFEGVRADLTEPSTLEAAPDADAVVFAASSGGRGVEAAREVYVGGLEAAIEAFGSRDKPPERLVYTSSTGVLGDHGGDWVDETTPVEPATPRAEVLAEAERVALETPDEFGIDGTVARFAGLYGPNRYRLERYLEGPVTEGYLNLVHRDDAAGAVRHLLANDLARGETVQVIDDEPVSKWELADWLAAECGLEPPEKRTKAEYLESEDPPESRRARILSSKRCSNAKLRELGYEFAYPTFREGYRAAIERFGASNR